MAQRIDKQVRTFPAVKPEGHFFAVGLEMFRADFMPRSDNPALQERERRFDGVRMRVSVCVNPETVANRFVFCFYSHALRDAAIEVVIVREQDFQVLTDILADKLFKRSARYILRMEEAQIAAALPDADYRFLLGAAPANPRSVSATAHVGFIHFNLAAEHGSASLNHRCADSVTEVPRGLVADSERALNLTGRDAFLRFAEQIGRRKPFFKRQVSVIENRSGSDGELIAA